MGLQIEPLLWEGGGSEEPDVPSFPAYVGGDGPQDVVDERLWDEMGGCHIYVGMIWHRMGTPTDKWRSGTEAEFEGAKRSEKETGRPSAILFYRKTAIESHIGHEGIIESELDQTLTSRGERIVAHRDFAVCFAEADEASMKLRSRFSHGRLYGGFLRRRKSLPARMIHLLRCIALPLVLSQRAIKALPLAHASRRAAIKHVVFLETSWSIGEFVGVLIGPGSIKKSWK